MNPTQRHPIKLLPEHLIDQIKAGEVIERPAMVIKELVENALDAGASELNIHIINNGLDLIAVEDNGWGMSPEDLPTAFCRHATSKLERFEHLYQLLTYGFRGEALASIAAISRTRCLSAPAENPQDGGKFDINGGKQEPVLPWPSEKGGTSLYVKDLFYNTPARLKFIKSSISEKLALKRTLTSLMLANPHVSFSIKWDDKERQYYPAVDPDKLRERVAGLFFNNNEKVNLLLPFAQEYGSLKVQGFLSTTSSRGNTGKSHYILANGRTIHDPQIHRIVLNKTESLWPMGEKGHYFLRIEVPEEDIDVNIHPNKTQVKFFQTAEVLALISSALDHVCTPILDNSEGAALSPEGQQDSYPSPPPTDNREISSFGKKHLPLLETTSLIKITPNLYLIPSSPPQILRADRLLLIFLHAGLSRPLRGDNDLLPLLIGEPFPRNTLDDQGIQFFAKRGFLFELVGNVLSLHTIPRWCEGISLSLILHPLLNWYQQDPHHHIDSLLSQDFHLPEDTLTSSLLPPWNALQTEQLEEKNILKTPSPQDWEALLP